MNIGIIDDNVDIVELMSIYFKSKGFNIVCKSFAGETALDILKGINIDILILDNRLPGKNGIDIINEIYQIQPQIRVIMISGDPNIEKRALKCGISAFFQKPISLNEIFSYITTIKSIS